VGAPVSVKRLRVPAAEPPVRTWLRVVWLVGLVYAVASSTHPGGSGRHLAALLLTATTALGWGGWLTARYHKSDTASIVGIVVLAVSGGVLVALNHVGIAVIAVAAMCAASLYDVLAAAAVTAPGLLAAAVAVAATGHPASEVGWAATGAVAGLVVGLGRRQTQERVRQEAELAFARQRSEVERERADILADRNRIAREVHDVLAHTLSALSVQLEAMGSLVDDGAGRTEIRSAIGRSRRLVTDGLEETRRAVGLLRDEPVDAADRIAALAADNELTFRLEGEPRPLAPATGVALVRVAQEAVTNARKHAKGAAVTVALRFGDDAAELTVDNDRSETAAVVTTGGGYGLQGMRERIELVDGTLTAGPHGAGWRVQAVVPA